MRDPRWIGALIAIIGILLTVVASWTTARVDENSEQRLLTQQTKQAAAVLSTAILLIEEPLSTALTLQSEGGTASGSAAFTRFMTSYVGDGKPFVTASLWRRQGNGVVPVATTGAAPALAPSSAAARAYVLRSFDITKTVTRQIPAGAQSRIAWAKGDPKTGLAVYAERAIPANRRSPADRNSAFASLHYAIYIGPHITNAALSTTDVDPASLPLGGTTARSAIPFGDTELTLVTTPHAHLGSALSRWLPLLILGCGLLLTLIATVAGLWLVRGRREAEQDASTITTLYEQVESLYGQQRDLFERLQRALLPHAHPDMPELEFASQYVAGAHGIEIGGDWFSVVALDEHRFGFVVGDVSGRGVDTVAVMAQARFTIRAYLLDGQQPAEVLEKCSHQFDIATDGHLTTVIAGIGDVRTGEITIANAGHPAPLLLDGTARPVQAPPGRPLGTGPARYRQTTFHLSPGATIFCFTDGLVERRGEDIDVGLGRLASTLLEANGRSVDELVSHAVATLRNADASDDIAALAIRRVAVR